MKKLAICIPTYNREKYLIECVQSIIDDATSSNLVNDIQICISDNCSTDNSQAEIKRLQETTNLEIIYQQNIQNLGPDLNFLNCIAISSAVYCWFMGSDDCIVKTSLENIINEYESSLCTVYLFNRIDCDINLKPISVGNWFINSNQDIFNFGLDKDKILYFRSSQSLGAIFSFLSNIVFRKADWDKIKYNNSYTGTAYSHVFMLLSMLSNIQDSKLKFIKKRQYVYSRGGNDHFLKNGMVKRFSLDLDGYQKLAEDIYSSNIEVKEAFLSIMRHEHRLNKILTIRLLTNKKEWPVIFKKLKYFGYNISFLKALSTLPRLPIYLLKVLFWALDKVGLKL